MASRIRLLNEMCINQIAAGEVIERPCSVVKELLENAIDAQASRIDVAVEGGGVPFIRVRDNGIGMNEEEIRQAVMPHATSKITAFEDLLALDTLGFRGEALPSIASVADLEIVSREKESVAGSVCRWEAGVCLEQKTCGSPPGTTMTVRRLFANVPARLKFLKSANTEFGLIADMIGKLAMSRPDIGFSLAHPQRVVLQTPGNGMLRDVLSQVLGKEIVQNLVHAGAIYDGLSLDGYISLPQVQRSSKNTQTFIVNGRVVRSKVLNQALRQGYHTHMPEGNHPAAVLVLTLDPSLIDINVHPAKTEIKFHDEGLVFERVCDTLKQTLAQARFAEPLNLATGRKDFPVAETPQEYLVKPDTKQTGPSTLEIILDGVRSPLHNTGAEEENLPETSGDDTPAASVTDEPAQEEPTHNLLQEIALSREAISSKEAYFIQQEGLNSINTIIEKKLAKKNLRQHFGEGISINQFLTDDLKTADPSGQDTSSDTVLYCSQPEEEPGLFLPLNENEAFFQGLRPLAQIFKTYILTEGKDAVFLIDQHAAHERIRYEEYLDEAQQSEAASQLLLTPLTLHLTLREEQAMLEYLPRLREIGFLIEDFGTRTYLLRGVPVGSGQLDAQEYFHRFLDNVLTGSTVPNLSELMEKWIFVLACHRSVKASDALSLTEMSELLRRLGKTRHPYSCPHGRPVLVSFTRKELEKRFGRL